MSFASRFPNVARLLGSTANAGAQDQPPEDDQDQGGDDQDQGGDGGDDQDQGGDDQDQGGNGGGDQAASQADLQRAFEKDAGALVSAERKRCVTVFTSDAGKRNPDAAAGMLNDSNMDAAKINAILGTVAGGSSSNSRQAHRDRINDARETRTDTGEGREAGDKDGVRERVKADRQKRNEAHSKKGAVKADRTEFDV